MSKTGLEQGGLRGYLLQEGDPSVPVVEFETVFPVQSQQSGPRGSPQWFSKERRFYEEAGV
jgi:hypothetical protein